MKILGLVLMAPLTFFLIGLVLVTFVTDPVAVIAQVIGATMIISFIAGILIFTDAL